MKKFLSICMLAVALIGCQGQNEPDADNPNVNPHLVNVVIHFQNLLPSEVVELDMLLQKDTLIDGSSPEYIYYTKIYRKDMEGSDIQFCLNALPTYNGVSFKCGYYQLLLNRADGYYYSIMPELDLKELDKYTDLEYNLTQIESKYYENDYYNKGNAYYKLISSKKR